jgi:hypothetical protein
MLTGRADKGEVEWVEEQNHVLLSNVIGELDLQITKCRNGK